MGSVYFGNPFGEHSFGSYFAGYAADAQTIQLSREGKDRPLQASCEKLSENPSPADMVKDFAGRQRATFSDPRAVRNCQGQDVCALLKGLSQSPAFADKGLKAAVANAEKCLAEAFGAIDGLDAVPADKLAGQLTELEAAAAQGRACKDNALDEALVKCSDAAAALADLYNAPGFLSKADEGLLDALDALQERFSTTPTELCRVIESFSSAENLDGKTLSNVLASQDNDSANFDSPSVQAFMTAIADVGREIDVFAGSAGSNLSSDEVQKIADAIRERAVAASRKLDACTSLSGELTRAFREKLDGLVARLDSRNQMLVDLANKPDFAALHGSGLRSSGTLLRLLEDDRFSASWYAAALEKGVPEEIIDMRHAPDKMIVEANRSNAVGQGVFNTVYEERFSGKGSVQGEHDLVGKNIGQAQKGLPSHSDSSYGALLGLIPKNLLVNNYSSWRTSQKLTGSCPIVSCTVGESQKGVHEGGDKLTMFMDKAPGSTVKSRKFGDCKQFFLEQTKANRLSIVGQVFEQASDLDFSDWISGQSDRHMDNVMIHIGAEGDKPVATLRGIDNDMSFMSNRVGLARFRIPADKFKDLLEGWNSGAVNDPDRSVRIFWPYRNLPEDCATNPKFSSWIKKVTTSDGREYVELDAEKAPLEFEGGFRSTFGLQSRRRPSYASQKTYDRIMAAAGKLHALPDSADKVAKQHEILGISQDVDGEAFEAALSRFEEVVAHLKALKAKGSVYSGSDFTDLAKLRQIYGRSSEHKRDITNRFANFDVNKIYDGDTRLSKEDLEELGKKSRKTWFHATHSIGDSALFVFMGLGFGLDDLSKA